MFTDVLNLPINSDRANRADQILTLNNMSWSDYEQLVETDIGYKASYWNGIITIVSPSRNHERIAEIINGLIKTYCRKYNLIYFPMGSTTIKNSPLAGKEPDRSFAFKIDKSIPDLAIEVTYTSGSIADLEKYQSLGVKEVWFWRMETLPFRELVPHSRWQDNKIAFYQLVDSEYLETQNSICLPEISSNFLITFVNRGLKETPLTIEEDFYQQLS
ncbi:MAG: Uma2 family endonuclease [Pleurocapsa minor HA4230-MV1]|jgi:Uma2 family endonuclease|nr:Uma2 family endonuclease [Pleurocapsa minor HA4230-MV1]